jgi:transposase
VRDIALDVHIDFCEVAIAERGEVRSAGRIATKPEEIELFAQSLDPRDRVALEVTGNAWAITRLIEPHVAEVIVVSPNDTGIRGARAKTDRLDARTLAKLLAAGELDGVWMPDRCTQVMRRRVGRRAQLVRSRARAKNEIHATLMRCLVGRAPFREPFGPKGRRWLAELELPAEERESVDAALRQIEFLDSEIEAVERLIAAAALDSAEIKRLMTVPGVNVICAATFIAAIGEIGRFPSPRKLVGYLGLDPRVSQSGSAPATHGRISKQGSVAARHALVELVGGPPAGAAARLLPADPLAARPQRRDRRGRAQARLPVLVPAHPFRGLRLPATVLDRQETAAARDPRRRADAQGRLHRDLRDPPEDARRRARARGAGRVRLQAVGRRVAADAGREEQGRRRDTGARIWWAVKRPSNAAGPSPWARSLARRLPTPATNSHKQEAKRPARA